MKKMKCAAFCLVLLACMLMQGTVSAQAATDNEQLCWPVTPATTVPTTMQEIKELLESDANKKYFHNVVLSSGDADTLSFLFPQYLDHTFKDDPQKKYFIWQRVFITAYVGADRPTVMHTSGYMVDTSRVSYYDIAQALDANMIQVEHRYTGVSKPDGTAHKDQGGILEDKNFWDYCTANQAADDLAYVANTLRRLGIFKGKWVATGASKCGMTTTFLAMYRPSTCDIYLPFCAPFCNTLQERLCHYVYADYGGRLARHSKQDSITWAGSWMAIKDYIANAYLQAPLHERLKEHFKKTMDVSAWTDESCMHLMARLFEDSQWIKATYFQVNQWQHLIPSRLASDAIPSKAYVDSMYTYLTANDDTLYNNMKNQQQAAAMRRSSLMDMRQYEVFPQRSATHRAGELIGGIDPEIYNADEYYVQTIYELGHVVGDYSYLHNLVKENLYEELVYASLSFNEYGCSKIATNIGLNTEVEFYTDPQKPMGPKLIGLAGNKGPIMPKTPIAPQVREFIKTTQVPILFVYGEFDPWTQSGITDAEVAAAANPNVQRFEVPSGTHSHSVLGKSYSSDPNAGQTVIDRVKAMLNKAPSAIRSVTRSTVPAADNAVYDLQGRRVTNATRKGVYIQNGRLVLKGM